MPKRIPVAEAKRVALAQGCKQVILIAWDGELTHCVTYGTTKKECGEAALGGKKIMKSLGFDSESES